MAERAAGRDARAAAAAAADRRARPADRRAAERAGRARTRGRAGEGGRRPAGDPRRRARARGAAPRDDGEHGPDPPGRPPRDLPPAHGRDAGARGAGPGARRDGLTGRHDAADDRVASIVASAPRDPPRPGRRPCQDRATSDRSPIAIAAVDRRWPGAVRSGSNCRRRHELGHDALPGRGSRGRRRPGARLPSPSRSGPDPGTDRIVSVEIAIARSHPSRS